MLQDDSSNDTIEHVHSAAIHEDSYNDIPHQTQYPIARIIFPSTSYQSNSSGRSGRSGSDRWMYPESISAIVMEEDDSVNSSLRSRWVAYAVYVVVAMTLIAIAILILSVMGVLSKVEPTTVITSKPTLSPTGLPTSSPTITIRNIPIPASTVISDPTVPNISTNAPTVTPIKKPTSTQTQTQTPIDDPDNNSGTSLGRDKDPSRFPSPGSSTISPPVPVPKPIPRTSIKPTVLKTPPPVPIWTSSKWSDISPELNITEAISVSISFDGSILAVLNKEGIVVLKKDAITSEWTTYGDDGISALMLSGRTSLALLLSSALTTEITLSHDGTQLFWYIAFKLEDEVSGSIDERGQAILFRSEQSQGSPMEWKQQGDKATLGTSPGSDDSRRFGPVVAFARTSVDTFVTGTTTVVGEITSIFDIHLGTPKVHRLQNGVWSSEVKDSLIHYSVADIEDVVFDPLVGVSVAISGDGTSIAVASPDSGQLLLLGDKKDTGKVQVFEPAPPRHTLLTNWKHKGVAMRGTGENHKFGIVSMSNDGRTMAVGTPNRERQRAGQVKVFRYNQEEDEWKPFFQDSKPSNTINNIDGKYGQVVCLSPNGRVLAVAHPLLGEVCVFDVEENKQIGECFQENIPERNEDMLNFKLALSHDGSRLVIGVPPTRTEIGQMRVYQLLE